MKKILFVLSLLCACSFIQAEKITRTDDFKDGESKFGFEAKADKKKKHTVELDGEYLILTSKKDWYEIGTRFPVVTRQNFKISYQLLIPKLDDDRVVGLVFNYEEDEDDETKTKGDRLYITENKFYLANADGDKLGKSEKIKLKKGKDVKVDVVIEKKRKNVLISINGVDFTNEDLEIRTPYMGFIVNEDSQLKVDKITVEQIVSED